MPQRTGERANVVTRRGVPDRGAVSSLRMLADQAFSRAAGAPLVDGNDVRLLKDARENYPAWLDAIAAARHHVHFENYIFTGDETGEMFADAFLRKAQEGVAVRVIYDWFGSDGKIATGFWDRLRAGGVEVRVYNPPRIDSPFAWISRDHRKMVAVDGELAFVTGLCIGNEWVGNPEKGIDPWRDTGVSIRGPAVAAVEEAFSEMWSLTGEPLPAGGLYDGAQIPPPAGEMRVRIVAGLPATAGMFRVDQLIAAMARQRLWLTDAYFVGTTPYLQALRAAARDGVDVRLLVPSATDLPFIRPLSRAGYRPLLNAGVRVFEWNGPMLHAKTAVADGVWARVGSTNLNVASFIGNCELDAVIEDPSFAHQLEAMYEEDLENATEVVLDMRRRPRRAGNERGRHGARRHRGSVGRATAGAIRISSAVGAAFTDRRTLEPIEARLVTGAGVGLLVLSVLIVFFPWILTYPLAFIGVWTALALLWKGFQLFRAGRRNENEKT